VGARRAPACMVTRRTPAASLRKRAEEECGNRQHRDPGGRPSRSRRVHRGGGARGPHPRLDPGEPWRPGGPAGERAPKARPPDSGPERGRPGRGSLCGPGRHPRARYRGYGDGVEHPPQGRADGQVPAPRRRGPLTQRRGARGRMAARLDGIPAPLRTGAGGVRPRPFRLRSRPVARLGPPASGTREAEASRRGYTSSGRPPGSPITCRPRWPPRRR
jgi:hypothetical protein